MRQHIGLPLDVALRCQIQAPLDVCLRRLVRACHLKLAWDAVSACCFVWNYVWCIRHTSRGWRHNIYMACGVGSGCCIHAALICGKGCFEATWKLGSMQPTHTPYALTHTICLQRDLNSWYLVWNHYSQPPELRSKQADFELYKKEWLWIHNCINPA